MKAKKEEFRIKATTRIELDHMNQDERNQVETEWQEIVAESAQWDKDEAERRVEEERKQREAEREREKKRDARRSKWFSIKYDAKQWFWDTFEFPIMIAFVTIVPALVIGLPTGFFLYWVLPWISANYGG